MVIIIFFVLHWYLSLFFQSFFHHRYAAHCYCTMSPNWEKFFNVCCFLTQGSSYISAYSYGIMHRMHHEHTDLEHDPHSPSHHDNHLNFLKTMLETRNSYHSIYSGKTPIDDKFKKNLPRWDVFENFAHSWITRICWIAIYTTFYILFATAWWQFLLLPFTIIMSTLHGAAINWWAHKFGYTNYEVDDTSKNILPVDLIFWGEAYHNNHHKYPGRANNAHKWFEIDSAFFVMRVMNKLNIIQLKRA